MHDNHVNTVLPAIISGSDGRTVWGERAWATQTRGGMVLTPRVGCSSLRLRESGPGYRSDWHVAGDPTLIVVRRGVLRLTLRDGSARDFQPGDAFIAADRLAAGESFNDQLHGHRAEVVGDTPLEAIHVKLDAG